METQQKTALITGGTSGIGLELARLFAKDHYNLVLVARDETELKATAIELEQEYHVLVMTIPKDLFRRESPFEIYEEVRAEGIKVSVLVNDAGQGEFGEFTDTDINRELDIIQLNIAAYVTLTKLFLKDMILRNQGKILNVGSIAGEAPGPFHAVYHGTKAFVNSWSAAIRNELKDTNITVTTLLPGATDTDFFAKANMEDSKILDTKLADPAKVARDGYDALMAGDAKITSGFKNKVQVALSGVMPDSMAAENMRQQQKPKGES